MEDFLSLITEYGPYIGLAITVSGITQALVKGFKNFFKKSQVGLRILPFIPIVLGMIGGLLLPLDTTQNDVLVGGMLGTLSMFFYKVVTRTLAPGSILREKIGE
jgi:hypothetical protein